LHNPRKTYYESENAVAVATTKHGYAMRRCVETDSMHKANAKSVIKVLVLIGAVLALNACHTMAGVGEDMSQVGKSIEHHADKHAH
jgi:predicted small secreted protein